MAGPWAPADRRAGERAGCASRDSAAGAGRGRALGRHGRRAPLGSAPRGRGGAGRAPPTDGPTDPPSAPGRLSAGGYGPRGAPTPSSLRRA